MIDVFDKMLYLHTVQKSLWAFVAGFRTKQLDQPNHEQLHCLENWVKVRLTKALDSIQQIHNYDVATEVVNAVIQTAQEYGGLFEHQ